MPSRSLTVTLNYDHSKKFVLVLNTQNRPKEVILRDARNKFRRKDFSLVFLRGGIPLDDDADLPVTVTQVWVSKGESYNGPPAVVQPNSQAEMRIISGKSYIDDTAVKQLQYISGLPGVRLAVGMPDLHPGNRFPIGCAIACQGIYPALIGSDIGCGIALYRLSSSSRSSLSNPKKIATMLRGLDEPWSGSVPTWLAKYGIDRSSPFDLKSLGTVGAGNHFAEICAVEDIFDASVAETLKIRKDDLYLLVHTGSRGLGGSILAEQTVNNANPYIPPDSPSLSTYLADHDYAVQWAIANRDLVAYRIKELLYPRLQRNEDDVENLSSSEAEKIIDVTHNSVTSHSLSINDDIQELWVHRKGAAPADRGIAPCPGSRGDFTWLLQPTGNGYHNIQSLAHGAGRRYGRNALHVGAKIDKSSLTTTALGSEVVCTDPDLLIEERPEAYKDVRCVVDDMEEWGICKGVVTFRPVVTYKVREAGEGRK